MDKDQRHIIEVTDLVKTYDGFHAVDGLSLSIDRGEIFGLLGPNGAGKTTTIECIVGLRKPTSGTIQVLEMDPSTDRKAFTSRVAVQPQSASIFEHLTVTETLSLFASFHSAPRQVRDVVSDIGLDESASVRAVKLSGGQMRRLLLGVALVGDPEIIVLDEPSAGLDPTARQSLWRVIRGLRDAGTTVLLSTHHMDEASELCDRVAIVVEGRIAAIGTPEGLINQFSSVSTLAFSVAPTTSRARLTELLGTMRLRVVEVGGALEVTVETGKPDDLIRRLTFASDVKARGFSVKRTSLEEVFLQVSGEDARRDRGVPADRRRRRV